MKMNFGGMCVFCFLETELEHQLASKNLSIVLNKLGPKDARRYVSTS